LPSHAQTGETRTATRSSWGAAGACDARDRKKKRKNKGVALWKSCVALTCRHRGEGRAGRDECGAGDECESHFGREDGGGTFPSSVKSTSQRGRIVLFSNRRNSKRRGPKITTQLTCKNCEHHYTDHDTMNTIKNNPKFFHRLTAGVGCNRAERHNIAGLGTHLQV
jgi:hypothetical protein